MAVSTWDFKKLIFTVAGQTMSGFSGDISIEHGSGEDQVTKVKSTDGASTALVFINDDSGSVTFELMASSASNDMLSALWAGKIVGPLLIRDTNGRTVLEAPSAAVAKLPTVTYGAEMSGREWKLVYADAKFVIGGLAQVS